MSTHTHDHESNATISGRVKHLVATLEAREILTEDDLDRRVEEFVLAASPQNGRRLVARAWVDPAFKQRGAR